MITVIALLGRRDQAANLRANWVRQTVDDRRLLVIENGRAIGACALVGLTPDETLTGPCDVVELRNIGLNWVREHGGGLFAFFDDDDHYSAKYLREARSALLSGEDAFVGKCNRFLHTDSGLWLLDGANCSQHGNTIPVGTCCLAGRVEDAVEFRRNTYAWGEDVLWCEDMFAAGHTCAITSAHNFAYRRGDPEDHLYQDSPESIVRGWVHHGHRAWQCGPWDPDVVAGRKQVTALPLDCGEWSPFDLATARAAAADLGWDLRKDAITWQAS